METLDQKLKRLEETIKKNSQARSAETIINTAFAKDQNYAKQQARGILTKKAHQSNQTKFKLVVWYNLKGDGKTPYSVIEKNNNLNRKYHDSIDIYPVQCDITKQIEYVTRHDLAFEKLFNHLVYYANRIDKACMFVNDFANDEELMIIKWHSDLSRTLFVQPEWKEMNGNMFYSGLSRPALKVDKMRY